VTEEAISNVLNGVKEAFWTNVIPVIANHRNKMLKTINSN